MWGRGGLGLWLLAKENFVKNICPYEGSSALKMEVAGSCETLVNILRDYMVLIPPEDNNAQKGCEF
jgi:hypothetical protein